MRHRVPLSAALLLLGACSSAPAGGSEPSPPPAPPPAEAPERGEPSETAAEPEEPAAEPAEPSQPSQDTPPLHDYQTVELEIRGRLLRADDTPAHCGIFHFAAAREYEVLEVLRGAWSEPRLIGLQSCPELSSALALSSVYRVSLSEEAPSGMSVMDDLGSPAMRRFYIVSAVPELLGPAPQPSTP